MVLGALAIFLCFVVVAIYSAKWFYMRLTNTLPPGPFPLPVIGNLHLFTDSGRIHLTLTELSKKYGDIFTVFMGSKPWIVLSSYAILKETFGKSGHVFSGRPHNGIMRFNKGLGIGFSEGKLWKDQRTFAVTHLREFGFGKKSFEFNVKQEIGFLLTAMETLDGQAFDLRPFLENAVANIMCQILFGERYEYDDHSFRRILNAFTESLSDASSAIVLVDMFPFLAHIPGDALKVKRIETNVRIYQTFLKERIEEHSRTLSTENVRDFTDAYLVQILEGKSCPEGSNFSDSQCLGVLQDLFAGGFETTTNTLLSGLLHLVLNIEIQCKLQDEIDRVIGCNQFPSLSDLPRMPYVEATLHEMLRVGNPLPLGVPHRVTETVKVRDYAIPAGTTIIPNLSALDLNDVTYKDPLMFDPNHFLKDGHFAKPDSFIPFGVGRRMCAGDSVAKMELFLFITSLLQTFHFRLPDGKPEPSTERQLGFTCCPRPFQLVVVPRKNKNNNNNKTPLCMSRIPQHLE